MNLCMKNANLYISMYVLSFLLDGHIIIYKHEYCMSKLFM